MQSIECNHKDVQTARKGQECAIKIVNHGNPNMTYGGSSTTTTSCSRR